MAAKSENLVSSLNYVPVGIGNYVALSAFPVDVFAVGGVDVDAFNANGAAAAGVVPKR